MRSSCRTRAAGRSRVFTPRAGGPRPDPPLPGGVASWGDASWGDASWGSSAVSDNAATDLGSPYVLDPVQEALAAAELGVTIDSDGSVVDASLSPTTQL